MSQRTSICSPFLSCRVPSPPVEGIPNLPVAEALQGPKTVSPSYMYLSTPIYVHYVGLTYTSCDLIASLLPMLSTKEVESLCCNGCRQLQVHLSTGSWTLQRILSCPRSIKCCLPLIKSCMCVNLPDTFHLACYVESLREDKVRSPSNHHPESYFCERVLRVSSPKEIAVNHTTSRIHPRSSSS